MLGARPCSCLVRTPFSRCGLPALTRAVSVVGFLGIYDPAAGGPRGTGRARRRVVREDSDEGLAAIAHCARTRPMPRRKYGQPPSRT